MAIPEISHQSINSHHERFLLWDTKWSKWQIYVLVMIYSLPSSGYIWSYRHNIQHIPANVYHCKDTPFLIHVGLIIQSTEIYHEDVSMLPMYMAYIRFVFIAICATYNLSIEDRGCHKCCNHRYTNSHI